MSKRAIQFTSENFPPGRPEQSSIYKIDIIRIGHHEYWTLCFHTTQVGVIPALTPHPPTSDSRWVLISIVCEGTAVFQYWRRTVPRPRKRTRKAEQQ